MLGSATKNRLTDEDKKPNSCCAKTYNISGIQSYRTEKSELFEEKANNSCSRNNIIVDQIELLLEKRILLDRVVQKSIPIRGQRLHFRNGRSKRRFFIPLTKFHDRRRVIIDRSIYRSSLSPRIGATSFTPSTCMGEPWVTMTIIVWPRVHAPRCVVVVEGGLVGDSSRFKAQGSLLYSPRQWLLGEVLSWVISGIFWFRIWEAWREISVGWIEISEWMEEEILRNPV